MIFGGGPVDPVKPGGTEKLQVRWWGGSTCSLAIRYPSGVTQKLAAHKLAGSGPTVPTSWSWTVPTKSGYGTATITASCTYVGATKTDKVPFQVWSGKATPVSIPTIAVTGVTPISLGSPLHWDFVFSTVPQVCEVTFSLLGTLKGSSESFNPSSTHASYEYPLPTGPVGTWQWQAGCYYPTPIPGGYSNTVKGQIVVQ